MPRYLRGVFLLICLLLVTCTTKDGELVSFNPSFGSIFVSSTVPDARIFLDYKDTGLKTPALINDVRVGRHVIHIFLSRYKPDVDSMIVEVEEGEETSISFELINVPTVGNLKIITNPDGALVAINKLEFGYTPFEVTGLLTGPHNVRIIKSGYSIIVKDIQIAQNQTKEINENLSLKRLVFFEHFSNTDCAPCVDVDVIIEETVKELGSSNIVSLGYHPNFPGPADPFYLEARPENNARRAYYNLLFVPNGIIDGIKQINTTSLSELRDNILSAFNERRQIQPQSILEIMDFETVVDTITGRVMITALENLGADVHLRIALINRNIDTGSPPGNNGQTHFFDVLRDMYPDAQGVSMNMSANEKQSVSFRFVRRPAWQDDLEVIAFLQDDATKEILQSVWTVSP